MSVHAFETLVIFREKPHRNANVAYL